MLTQKKPPKTGAGSCAYETWPQSTLLREVRAAASRVPSASASLLSSATRRRGPRSSRVCGPVRARARGGGWVGPLAAVPIIQGTARPGQVARCSGGFGFGGVLAPGVGSLVAEGHISLGVELAGLGGEGFQQIGAAGHFGSPLPQKPGLTGHAGECGWGLAIHAVPFVGVDPGRAPAGIAEPIYSGLLVRNPPLTASPLGFREALKPIPEVDEPLSIRALGSRGRSKGAVVGAVVGAGHGGSPFGIPTQYGRHDRMQGGGSDV